MKTESLQKRIARGVRYLNKEYGRSWLRRINLDKLDMGEPNGPCGCILSQLEGDYNKGASLIEPDVCKLPEAASAYGFERVYLEGGSWVESYRVLTNAWRQKIKELRSQQ